jgi:hypothetical protein
MLDAKPNRSPFPPGLHLLREGEQLDTTKYPYSSMVGSLMYLAITTRPDLAYYTGELAKYMTGPTVQHWVAAKGVLRYLAGTKSLGITYARSGNDKLIGYGDADYAGDPDTRRSTTGYVFTLNGGAVSWKSTRQPTVALSTTEAEYMAAAHAAKEALWFRKLLCSDLGLADPSLPVTIFTDNQSALKLVKHPVASARSKHIDVLHHFARERMASSEIAFEYIPTNSMVADCLTKALAPIKLSACVKGMGMSLG